MCRLLYQLDTIDGYLNTTRLVKAAYRLLEVLLTAAKGAHNNIGIGLIAIRQESSGLLQLIHDTFGYSAIAYSLLLYK